MDKLRTPFNMIILGMTGCGKTHYLLKELKKSYKGHFDYIFLICPTYEWNKTYQDWEYKDDKDFIVLPSKHDTVDLCLQHVVKFSKGTNSLIILDDCAGGQSVKNRVSELVNLAFSARHFGLSTIVITQQLTSITKPYRENISKLITFYNPNRKDMQTVFDEYLSVSKDEETRIRDHLKDNDYARLEVLLRRPYNYSITK